jgi:hypothetical protein
MLTFYRNPQCVVYKLNFITMRRVPLFCFVMLWVGCGILPLAAQTLADTSANADSSNVDENIERVLDVQAEQSGNSELVEQLYLLRNRKLNVNRCNYTDLSAIPFLTAQDAQAILDVRQRQTYIFSLNDLKPVLSEETFSLISNFLTVDLRDTRMVNEPSFISDLRNGILWRTARVEVINRTLLESPVRQGLINGAYLGSSPKVYNRAQVFLSENFTVSALTEKDVGEQSLADFYSASVQIKNIYNLKTLVLGDYNLAFGQGLAIYSARLLFKSPESIFSVKPSARPLRLYGSTFEQNFFRGAAAELEFGKISVIGFWSNNFFTASQSDTSFTSFSTTGLNRSQTEISRKNNTQELTLGGHLSARVPLPVGALKLGATYFTSRYSVPLVPASRFDNFFAFRGTEISVAAADLDAVWGRVNVFGEVARSIEQQATSFVAGVQTNWSERWRRDIRTVIAIRRLDERYFSPHAAVFAERGDDGQNENGIYFGASMRFSDDWSMRAYYDTFQFPFLNFLAVLPSSGDDLLMQLTWKTIGTEKSKYSLSVLVQQKRFDDALTQVDDATRELRAAVPIVLRRLRTDLNYLITPTFTLRTRGEVKRIDKTLLNGIRTENGWLIFQEIGYRTLRKNFAIDARLAFFSTESFDAAIYAFEDNLPLFPSVFAHAGRGRRLYLNFRYTIFGNTELGVRFANTFRDDVESVGSGNDRFNTNSPSLFSVGLRARF